MSDFKARYEFRNDPRYQEFEKAAIAFLSKRKTRESPFVEFAERLDDYFFLDDKKMPIQELVEKIYGSVGEKI